MNFDFIPYRLNAEINDFKDEIQYISSDNGVDLYKVREGFIEPLMGFRVSDVNLYFFEANLITIYIKMGEVVENIFEVREALNIVFQEQAKNLNDEIGIVYYWKNESEFLGLFVSTKRNNLIIYHTLNKYNIYNT